MAKKFLTLNIGAASIQLAEYEAGSGGALTLLNYGTADLAAPIDAGNADTILSPAIMQIVREKGIKPGKVALSVSGQMAFPRPCAIAAAGGGDKFEQMVRYEVEQNIPFPLDEMVCDHQVLGDTENGDKAVLIVAAKIDQIEAITSAVTAAGFSPEIVDVAPVALVNALRTLKGDDGSSVIILDIGAKTTSLIIAEGEKLYLRAIPVAGNTITKDIAQHLGCTLEEAENYKRQSAYVSLGGVTEDEDPTLDSISKICRKDMTRLNAEISRSVNFFRSQQNGGAPSKLYITGGSALLPQTAEFFADSLGIEVEFFNPFENISVGPRVDAQSLETAAAFLGATAGLAIHAAGNAPISINLLPPSILAERAEVKRIPVLAVAGVALVAALAGVLFAVNHSIDVIDAQTDSISGMASSLKSFEAKIKTAEAAADEQFAESSAMRDLVFKRVSLAAHLHAVRFALEKDSKGEPLLWIEKWEDGKVTIRGWKDRVKTFIDNAAAKGASERTAPEIVVARLKAHPAVVADSVKVTDMSTLGKDGSIEQFAVELEFK